MRFRHVPSDLVLLLAFIVVLLFLLTPFLSAQAQVPGKTAPAVATEKAAAPAALTELQKTKAENFLLKATNLNLQKQSVEAQLQTAQAELEKTRLALEAEFIDTLKCKDGWDWQKVACKAPEKPPEPAKK